MDKLLGTGITGSVVMAICCVTPVLVVLVTAVGLSAIVGYLDYVLFPALAFFLGLTGYALYRRSKRAPVAQRVAAQANPETEES
ncbi:MAG: mercury resistance system transport protein MerF [Proteobacteria bacterium]|nr:mercury resistance system transport protein MerF [Pseudomonadota bacterium]